MTRQELLDACERCERAYGDVFPLAALVAQGSTDFLFDPLTRTCFVFVEDGLVTIPATNDLDAASETPLLQYPQDYVSDRPDQVQLDLRRSVEAALVHLLQLAKLADRLRA